MLRLVFFRGRIYGRPDRHMEVFACFFAAHANKNRKTIFITPLSHGCVVPYLATGNPRSPAERGKRREESPAF